MNATTTTSRDECVSNDIALRNQLVIEKLDDLHGMLSKFSRRYDIDYDDCYQHVALRMLEACPKIPAGYDVGGYLYVVARNGLNMMLRSHIDSKELERSMDMVRTEDGATLADMLQAPDESSLKAEMQHMDKVTEVVHSALRECRIEEQEYACKSFELNAYKPVPPTNHPLLNYNCKKNKPRRTDSMRRSIKKTLHENAQVLKLIQREACIL